MSVPAGMVPAWQSRRRRFRCTECGWQAAKWVGRCGECQAWGTVEETAVPRLVRAGDPGGGLRRRGGPRGASAAARCRPGAADRPGRRGQAAARTTGLDELDRVLGGGLVPGAVVLLAGEPGVGKSTLLLEAGALVATTGPVLYVTGEESPPRSGCAPTGSVPWRPPLPGRRDRPGRRPRPRRRGQPRLLILDSVQTIAAGDLDGAPGGVTQVREVAAALTACQGRA